MAVTVGAGTSASTSASAAGGSGSPPLAPKGSERVEKLLSSMTLAEKITMIGGTGFGTQPIPRLGIPAFRMSDGPSGVRSPGPSTAYAGGVALAATWDPALAKEVGTQIGRDARARGTRFMLGPGANIYRAPMNGRNFEYLGEDPFLASRIVVGYIDGVQSQGVSATIKHYVGNDSEFARHDSDSTIDERTLREIYLPAFAAAVREAHTGSIMSSYNLLNGEHATQNSHIVRIMKGDWGFHGIFMSDWSATYNGVASANAGLDLEMPNAKFMNRATLEPAVSSGKVSEAVITDKVRRILSTAERLGWLDSEALDPSLSRYSEAGRVAARKGALEGAVLLKNAGSVLPFDLKKVHDIAVIGPNAYPGVTTGGGSGHVFAFAPSSLLQGLGDKLGTSATVTYARGLQSLRIMSVLTRFTTSKEGGTWGAQVESFPDNTFSGQPVGKRTEVQFATGTAGFGGDPDLLTISDSLPSDRLQVLRGSVPAGPAPKTFDRWTSWYNATAAGEYTIFVQDTGSYRLKVDEEVVIDSVHIPLAVVRQTARTLSAGPHKLVLEQTGAPELGRTFLRVGVVKQGDFVDPEAKQLAAKADAVVVAVGFDSDIETEGNDREFALPPGQAELIREIGAANPNTIVVINSGGAVDVTPWIDSVKSVVEAWYPGQEGGAALAEVLTGDADATGRLPISWDRTLSQNPSFPNYYYNDAAHPDRVVYREGVFVGYRGYQRSKVKPIFPFGFGLSYTTFQYADLKVEPIAAAGATTAVPAGLTPLYTVSFEVTNTGSRSGTDVAQIYVGAKSSRVPRPVRELKGFARVDLAPGQTKRVTLSLDARSFTYFDPNASQWRADAGEYRVELGRSSEDIQAAQSLKLPHALKIAAAAE
jgi:beta-glucosidase